MQINWGKVETVILDLGGVILDIDYFATINAFVELGIPEFESKYSQLSQEGLFDQLETGQITGDEFVQGIQAFAPEIQADQILSAWKAMLLDFPPGRLDTLKKIDARFQSFLLSNTNEIHFKDFEGILSRHGYKSLDEFFDKVYLSHQIHARKPDPEAFQIILHEHNLEPSQCLFVDDSPQHVEGARNLGIQAYNLTSETTLEDLFAPVLA